MSTLEELVDALIQNAYQAGEADGRLAFFERIGWIEHKERNARTIELRTQIIAYDRADDAVLVRREDVGMARIALKSYLAGKRYQGAANKAQLAYDHIRSALGDQ